MTGTPRDRARARTMQDITRIGREHLAEHGAAALSLRAVARDLGVVSSAVYRYVANRDDLLTLLVVDGFDELGDAVDSAIADVPVDDYRGRFLAVGQAVRTWARRERATYALLFGSPVPGYEAPGEQTTGPGTRVITTLVRLWDEAYAAGRLEVPHTETPVPEQLRKNFDAVRAQFDVDTPDELIARGVLVWAALFGCVSFEVFGQYGPGTFAEDALFELHLDLLAETLGLG